MKLPRFKFNTLLLYTGHVPVRDRHDWDTETTTVPSRKAIPGRDFCFIRRYVMNKNTRYASRPRLANKLPGGNMILRAYSNTPQVYIAELQGRWFTDSDQASSAAKRIFSKYPQVASIAFGRYQHDGLRYFKFLRR